MGKYPVNTVAVASKVVCHRAVFLDRDGVINRALERDGKPYAPRSLAEFELLPGVREACARLKQAGFLLVVVTNQPDVGRGTLKREVVEEIHGHMLKLLPIDRVEVCFHSGSEPAECDCRKPKPGMLFRAANALGINLCNSWMVGDRWRDIECGRAAGCKTILIDYGYNEQLLNEPDYRAKSLLDASRIIVEKSDI